MKEKTEINKFGLPNIVIPAEVLFCEGLTSTEKILFGFVNNLSYTEDGCWASNRYLGKLAGIRPETVSAMLSKLQKLGFLKIEYYTKPNGTNIRKIFIDKEYLIKHEETLQIKYKELNEDMPLKKPGKQKKKTPKAKIDPISKRKNPIKETLNPPKVNSEPPIGKRLTKLDNELGNEIEKRNKQKKTFLPPDFIVSDRVKKWAEKKGYKNLEEHLEAFKLTCTAKGYKYLDWDSAFMNAIRNNWARIGDKADDKYKEYGL